MEQNTEHIVNANMIDYKWRTSAQLPVIDQERNRVMRNFDHLDITTAEAARTVPARFGGRTRFNDLGPHELVRDIEVPGANTGHRPAFMKFPLRKPIDFAIVSVASVLTLEENRCIDACMVSGAVGPGPLRAS